jgi:predicted phage tail protein
VYVAPGRFIYSGVVVILSIALICAVLASLAVGVLVAYGVCIAMFGVFRIHARQVAETSARRVVASTQAIEG